MDDFQPDPRVAEALARLPEVRFEGVVWKHTLAGQSPIAANTKGARWNPAGVPAVYLALDRNTALAEGAHLVGVQSQPIRGTRHIHEVELRLGRVLDLRGIGALGRLGVSEADLRSADHSASRRVGGTAEWLGVEALMVPSARTDGANLVVFERRTPPDFEIRVSGAQPIDERGAS